MTHICKSHSQIVNFLGMIIIAAFGIVSTLGSGGGDGGDTTGTDTDWLLPVYNYEIKGVSDFGTTDGVTVHFDLNTRVRGNPNLLYGTFTCSSTTGICNLASISAGSKVEATDLSDSFFVGNHIITVLSDIYFSGGKYPTAGSYQISHSLNFTVDVSVSTCNSVAGVEIIVTEDSTIILEECYTWEQFENISDSDELGVRLAHFTYGIFGFFIDQSDLILIGFDTLDQIISPNTPYRLDCNSFSDAGLNPPDNPIPIPYMGYIDFTWLDDVEDLDLGTGDSFSTYFHYCWINDPSSDVDYLFQGMLDLVSYTEVIDQNGTLVRIGFEGTTGDPPKTGGVIYTDFVWYETLVTEPPTTEIISELWIMGGYSFVLFAP